MDVIAIVVLVVGLVAGIVVGVRAWRQHRGDLAALSAEEVALHGQCVAADRAVKAQEGSYRQLVRQAEKALQEAQTASKLASVGSLNFVTGADVTVNGSTHPLTPAVTAHLDETGDLTTYATSRSTLTRMAGGALIAGPAGLIVGGLAKKSKHHQVDHREIYLMVIGPDWSDVARINPKQGEAARRLMLTIKTAATNCEAFAVGQAERIAATSRALEGVRADTARIDGARATRQALGEDPLARVKAVRKGASSTADRRNVTLLPLDVEDDSAWRPGAQAPQDRPNA